MQDGAHPQIGWAQAGAEQSAAGAFLASLMPLDTAYISHSEIQFGLSLDGQTWGSQAQSLLVRYFQDLVEQGGQIARAIDAAGALRAAAAVVWHAEPPNSFASVQDIVVAPGARSQGLGARMMDFIEAEAKARGMAWIFLESGLRNHRAHAFFKTGGYAPASTTFAKRLAHF